ncbi:PLP-dependent transferase [Coraliomargarita parva]|uniref:PLP-dependent transferase n=1 Tax=Coraliomargarita parva TaxID=3014050 RepID=UPI0022B59160|nr:PLP-dependent transferase [Coraliomargarita parva]
MTTLRHYPLGTPYPNSPHAVASSLPTLRDVCGYEEKEPRVLDAMTSGYPRFVQNALVTRLIEFLLDRESLSGRASVLIPGKRAALELLRCVGPGPVLHEVEPGLVLLHYDPLDQALGARLRKYLQHIGCGISSREAEAWLLRFGLIDSAHREDRIPGNGRQAVEQAIADLSTVPVEDVLVCASGMNAFYAGFRAVQEVQAMRGRRRWLQLGWLYLDSGCILEEFLRDGEILEHHYDLTDTDALVRAIRAAGTELAAVVVECPSNPLVRVCDLRRVAEVVREEGGVMLVDPTIASIYNLDVMPYADLVVTSLTKYAAHQGDVMSGAVVLNRESVFYGDLVLRVSAYHAPAYDGDLRRLAFEMQSAPDVVRRMNANAARLCRYLKSHPAVRHIFCAGCSDHIEIVSRSEDPVGAVISMELHGSMRKFYDAVSVMKGPSFGTQFTILSPFMYLAHYDLVTKPEGVDFLASAGIDPDLIRISVGAEDYDEIEAVFDKALNLSLG